MFSLLELDRTRENIVVWNEDVSGGSSDEITLALEVVLGTGAGVKMGSRSRLHRASEAVDSELVFLYLILFLCLGFLIRPADYMCEWKSCRRTLDLEHRPSESLAKADASAEIYLDLKETEWIAPAHYARDTYEWKPCGRTRQLNVGGLRSFRYPSWIESNGARDLLAVARYNLLSIDINGRGRLFERENWTLPELYSVSENGLSNFDPRRRPWFSDSGMEQIELVIDHKIPKGTFTEPSLNLPSSAIRLDSIPELLLTLLRDGTIEILGINEKLCHIELRATIIYVLLPEIIMFVVILIMARERLRSRDLDALVFEESDLDDSCLNDRILYENLLKDAVLISSEGSSGQVFKVRFLGLECAMKVFHPSARMDFRKESLALLNLSHPHVVKLFCSFTKPFLVMELMDEDLFSFLTKIRERRIDYDLPFEVAVDVMLQIAEGMSFLHHQGIAHQDLKSLNILLKLRGEFGAPDFQIIAKIADLGSARRFDPRYPKGFLLVPNMNIGTRSWRAPELFHPRGSSWTRFLRKNPRVLPKPLDIYGFAVICSELVTKQIPFSSDQDLRVAVLGSKVREGHRPALPSSGCPEGLLTLINDCWHGDPVVRPEFHEVCTRLIEVKSSCGQSSRS